MSGKQIQPEQVQALPISGSGSKTAVGMQLADLNQQITMTSAQAQTDQDFDPPVPPSTTKAQFIEGFFNSQESPLIMSLTVSGILMILYGLIVVGKK